MRWSTNPSQSIHHWMDVHQIQGKYSWGGVTGVNLTCDYPSLSCNTINMCYVHANSVRWISNVDSPSITPEWRGLGEVKLIPEDRVISFGWVCNPCSRTQHSQSEIQRGALTESLSCVMHCTSDCLLCTCEYPITWHGKFHFNLFSRLIKKWLKPRKLGILVYWVSHLSII